MSDYKLVDATQLDADLTSICDTIRAKSNGLYTNEDKFDFPYGIEDGIEQVYEAGRLYAA